MANRWGLASTSAVAALLAAVACGGNPQVADTEDGDDVPSPGGNGGSGGTAGGPIIDLPGDGGLGGDGNTGGTSSPVGCGGVTCGAGQRCDLTGAEPECVDRTCEELECGELEECRPASGGGVICRSNACDSDVDCPLARHCDGQKCVDDACQPESRQCEAEGVLVCSANGAEQVPAYTCGSAGYFESVCTDANASAVGCSCEGDWDCPEYTVCETGVCKGTGVAPTCTLPPTPFEDVLPAREFRGAAPSLLRRSIPTASTRRAPTTTPLARRSRGRLRSARRRSSSISTTTTVTAS